MKVNAVVVLYNAKDDVVENIKTYIDYLETLYVIDNSDKVDHLLVDKINRISSKCIYIDNQGNKGIAYALNLGATLAIGNNANWLLTMDQDTSFVDSDCKTLIDIAFNINDDKIAIIAPLHYINENKVYDFYDTITMTSGNIINLEIFEKLKGFDNNLFIDSVDIDYCLKIYENGYLIKRVPNIILNHNLGDTKMYKIFGKTFYPTNHNYIRRYYITRNRLYVWSKYKKSYPDYIKFEKVLTLKEFIKILMFEKDKFKKMSFMVKGYIDYKKNKLGKLEK